MKLKEFVEIIKKSHIAGNNKKKIVYKLLLAVGAEGVSYHASSQSPSESTIQKWLSEKETPGVSRYFPNLKVKDEKGARDFLRKTPQKEQWIELRDLFKEWHNNTQNPDKDFYIDTETDDFDTFNISFWRQFISYFNSLSLWEDAEKEQLGIEDSLENDKSDWTNKMMGVFKENFMQFRVYAFIPKEINSVINSLEINYEIVNERIKLGEQDGSSSERSTILESVRMYCKWSFNSDYFSFCAVPFHKPFWKLKTLEGHVIIKHNERFTYDTFPINMWVSDDFKYAITKSCVFQDGQFDDGAFPWKECQGEFIIIDYDQPIDVNESHPIIEDCYVLIDEMLAQENDIDKFITAIREKIIEKYEGLMFDNSSRLLYNDIKQYIDALSKFKENLTKFRDLEKGKSRYFSDQRFIKAFDMYSAFSDFEVAPKPIYPFSESYLHSDEASKVQSDLRYYHKNLIDLYGEIIEYEGKGST